MHVAVIVLAAAAGWPLMSLASAAVTMYSADTIDTYSVADEAAVMEDLYEAMSAKNAFNVSAG